MRPATRKQRRSSNPLPSDILLTLGDLGLDIERVAKDEAWALCPNPKHPDRSASWSINLDTGEHNCFSCGWGGNYLMLVEHEMRLDEEQAEAWIRKRGGIGVARKKLRGEQAWSKKKAIEVTEADMVFYDPRIPMWALKDRDLVQESCERYGVRWDYQHAYWIIPIRDPYTGRLLGWQEKGKDHFLNVPDNLEKAQTLFGYDLLEDVAYLEESPLDCVRLDTYQVEGGVSGYGVHVSDFQMDLIVDKVDTLYVCLDNDAAGRAREKRIWREYRGRCRMLFANYEHVRGKNYKKDHGEMEPDEIAYSLDTAISALRYRPDDDD